MSSKPNRSKKTKRTPVRIITPRTAGLASSPKSSIDNSARAAAPPVEQPAAAVLVSKTLVPELKRIGILSAAMLLLLVILSLIF